MGKVKKWKDLHLRIEPEIYEEVKELAKNEGLNVSAFIRTLIHKKVKRERKKK